MSVLVSFCCVTVANESPNLSGITQMFWLQACVTYGSAVQDSRIQAVPLWDMLFSWQKVEQANWCLCRFAHVPLVQGGHTVHSPFTAEEVYFSYRAVLH